MYFTRWMKHKQIKTTLVRSNACVATCVLLSQLTTRNTQTAQTSAVRQHNRIVAVLPGSGSWSGTDSRIRIVMRIGDRHQNVISWSLGHTPALHKISSNPLVIRYSSESGFRTSDSCCIRTVIRIVTKFNSHGSWAMPFPPRNFVKICSHLFQLSDGQTDRQTDRKKHNLLLRRSRGGNKVHARVCKYCYTRSAAQNDSSPPQSSV